MNRRGEFGVEEALLELVIFSVFVILMFTIGGRAASSTIAESDLLGQNVQRLSQMMSFVDDVQLEYDFPIFPGAKFSSIGPSDSPRGTIIVGSRDDSKTFRYENNKRFGTLISINAEKLPLNIVSAGGVVSSGTISGSSISCDSKDFSRAQIFSSVVMESFSQTLSKLSPDKYSSTYTIQTPPTSPAVISDDFVILFSKNSGSNVEVLMNSKTSEIINTGKYACFIAKKILEKNIPVILGFVNPDSESDESVSLPSNKAGVEVSIPEGLSSSQIAIIQVVLIS